MKSILWFKMIVFTIFLGLFFSCTPQEGINKKTIVVASQRGHCQSVILQKCLFIKKPSQDNWEYFYDSIQGFTYEKGYEYVLIVSEKNISPVPADASSVLTSLVKIVSKVKMNSTNLPTTCNGVSNPLENLHWLQQIKKNFEASATATKKEIIQYTYKGKTVFYIDPCKNCADGLATVYNCLGKKMCEFGGIAGLNTCLSFEKEVTNKTILYEN